MKNSTLNRSMLSGENMAVLAELKSQNDALGQDVEAEYTKQPQSKQDELDYLWQNFKINPKEEKSPGIYILVGFIAGALSMFLMTAMLSITTFSNTDGAAAVQERKIVKKAHGSFAPIAPVEVQQTVSPEEQELLETPVPVTTEKYTVKAGDSLEAISVKFYGQASPENTLKIQQANELSSPHAIYAGQELVVPFN